MNKQKKRILALLVAIASTVGVQAQVFGLGGEAEGSATRSNNPGLFWNGMNGDGNGGASWNSMEDATPVGDGLLLLVVSGVCYAAAKNRRKSKN